MPTPYGSRFKAPAQVAAPAPVPAVPAGPSPAEVESLRREAQAAKAREAAAAKALEEANKQLAEVRAAAERETIRAALVAAASRPDRRAINPEHVVALRAADFVLHNGKVVSKADPSRDADTVLGEWFAGEGKYLLAPTMPGGGSGAPARAQGAQAAPPPDLKTAEGLTRRARELTAKVLGEKPRSVEAVTPAATPATPAKSG